MTRFRWTIRVVAYGGLSLANGVLGWWLCDSLGFELAFPIATQWSAMSGIGLALVIEGWLAS